MRILSSYKLSTQRYHLINYHIYCSYFLKALIQSQKTPAEIGTMIKRYGNKFQMYITYCNNKPKSEHIVTEHVQYFDLVRQKLGHRLDVSYAVTKSDG